MLHIVRCFSFNLVIQGNKYCAGILFKSSKLSSGKFHDNFRYYLHHLGSTLPLTSPHIKTEKFVLLPFPSFVTSVIDNIYLRKVLNKHKQKMRKHEWSGNSDHTVKKRRNSEEDLENYILKKKRKVLIKRLECEGDFKMHDKYNIFNVKQCFLIDSIEQAVTNFVEYRNSINRFVSQFNTLGSKVNTVAVMDDQQQKCEKPTDSTLAGENDNAFDSEKLLRNSIVEFSQHLASLNLSSFEKPHCESDTNIEGIKNEFINTKENDFRKKLQELREEEFTFRGNGLVGERVFPNEKRFYFKVMSYNVLSQALLEDNINLYRGYNRTYLNWSYRSKLLMQELLQHDADILCLQEVEDGHKQSFFDQLEKKGYKSVYKKRTHEKVDGCAIYYKTSKFQLVDYKSVEFFQRDIRVLDRDNIGIIAKLHPVGNPEKPVVVATTHLLYNPRRHDIKLAQIVLMLAEIERIAYDKNSEFKYNPVILTGDFNLEPYTSVYQLLLEGFLQYDGLDKKKLTYAGNLHPSDTFYRSNFGPPMGKRLLPPHIGITDNCTHFGLQELRNGPLGDRLNESDKYIGIYNSDRNIVPKSFPKAEYMNDTFQTGLLKNENFDFWSVYYHENKDNETEATTKHDDYVTVDYMLYTPLVDPVESHHQLQMVNRTRLPTISEWEKFIKNIPNQVCPSDHLPLVARFFLRIPSQTKRIVSDL